MSDLAILHFNISSYWHAGTGRGSASYLDALVHTNEAGLPTLPGRTVKGLLRDVIYRAECWQQVPEGLSSYLFGSIGFDEQQPRRETTPGVLSITNAELPIPMRQWLSIAEHNHYRQTLFTELYSTAVEQQTGSAKDKSLRGVQVTVPLSLSATLEYHGNDTEHKYSEWFSDLQKCLPLIRAVGANRNRGLGRVHVTVEKAL